jgi:phosphoserine phosphatase
MKDLVIQGPSLSSEALDTFKVVCTPERITLSRGSARCVTVADDPETRRAVRGLGDYWKLDCAFVDPSWTLTHFRLLAIDMDSTLITIESLDEVAAYAGKGDEVAAITEAAMRGEIADYGESLRRRVAMLEGVDAAVLQRVYDERLALSDGAERLVARCRAAGLRTLLVTGGFAFFTERLQRRLAIDATRSNELGVANGRLTGSVTGPNGGRIIDAERKADAVREQCAELACPTDRAIVIGDGANDVQMMALAGISVAWRAKPVAREKATFVLCHAPLDGVLTWFADAGAE